MTTCLRYLFRILTPIRIGCVKLRRLMSPQQAIPPVLTAVAVACLAHGAAWAQATVPSTQLPTGGVVSAGQASISQSGNTLNINQSSQRAIVDWNTFNVGKDATVNFQQPNAQSATLNRVADMQPSQIFGRITAPGQVILVNPQGVYFGKSSSVDVGGLVATTHTAVADEFMRGQLKFDRNGATGSVVNEGELRAALSGYIALLAPEVGNQGVIVANLGTVALAAGEAYELQFDGSGALSNVRVTPATLNTLVENKNAIIAPGGLVILSAQAASRLQSAVVNNTGRIEATALVNRGGRIVLEASGQVLNSGSLIASNVTGANANTATTATATVGSIEINTAQFTQTATGVLDVSAVNAQAGRVRLAVSDSIAMSGSVLAHSTTMGGQIELQATRRIDFDGAVLDASGADGGGRIHVSAPGAPADNSNNTLPVQGRVAITNNTVMRVSSSRAQAGRVEVEGDDISLDNTRIDATGATAGGSVLVGGDWQGSGTMKQATTVTMSADSVIDASATDNGNGGKVVLWSDVQNAASVSSVHGHLYANAGPNGGDGGQIETSGHYLNVDGVSGSANSVLGQSGLWLFDPYNVTITSSDYAGSFSSGTWTPSSDNSTILNSNINNLLNNGTNVTITTGASGGQLGNINVSSAIEKSWGSSDVTLKFVAANHIFVDANITQSGVGTGKLHMVFDADNSSTSGTTRDGGGIVLLGANGGAVTLSTGGGSVTFGGTVDGSNRSGGDLYVGGSTNPVLVSTYGGAFTVKGQLIVANSNATGFSVNTAGGAITLNSTIDSGNEYRFVDDSEISGAATGVDNWTKAQSDAQLKGGYLATITSSLENMLASAATLQSGTYRGSWIGIYRDKDNGSQPYAWKFAAGSPEAGSVVGIQGNLNGTSGGSGVTASAGYFQNFGSGEPNGAGTGGEYAGQFFGGQALWNDLVGTTGYSQSMSGPYNVMGYVLEKNLSPSVVRFTSAGGAVTISGAVGANKLIDALIVDSATFTAGAISTTSRLSVTNSSTASITGVISGTNTFTKDGSGTLTLSAANTYTGSTTINGGTLAFTDTAKIYASSNNAGPVTVNSGAVLDIKSWDWAANLGQLLYDQGNMVINGGTVRQSGSSANAAAGSNNSSRQFTVGAGGATFESATAGVTWTIDRDNRSNYQLATAGNVTLTGVGNFVFNTWLSGAYSLTKSGTGSATINGTNTYTGGTNINAGTLLLNTSNAIGSTGTISFGGGTLQHSASNTTDYSSRFSTAASQAYKLDTNSQNVTWATALTSAGGSLTKSGAGILTLSGANTYSGGATVSAGTLKVNVASVGSVGTITSSALGTGSATVASGASIDLNGNTVFNGLSLAGTGVSSGGALSNSSASVAAAATGPISLTATTSIISSPGITLGSVAGGAYALNVTAGTGAGTGDITFNGALTFSGENISTFTASRNIYINAPITVNGTTSSSGIALKYNQANGGGDYVFGMTTSGTGASLAASFNGAINFANTASTFTTQSYNATAKSFTLVSALTSAGESTSTFYCSTTTNCSASNSLNFALINNINASSFTGSNVRKLGTSSAAYAGTFTGLGHTITGLTLSGAGNVGMFYSTASGAAVRDLRLTNASITGTGNNTGALVGSAASSLTMTNVIMDGASTVSNSASSYVGGLMGSAGSGTLSNIYVLTTNVTGAGYVGGVVGNGNMTVTNVHKVGTVTGAGANVGGAFGYMSGTLNNVDSVGNVTVTGSNYSVGGLVGDAGASSITNAFATGAVAATSSYQVGGLIGVIGGTTMTGLSASGGSVSGTYRVGGLVGYVTGSGTITTASASGNVVGTSDTVGGLVGYFYSGTITSAMASGDVSGTSSVGGLVGYQYGGTTINTSSSSGRVTGSANLVGGLIGYTYLGSVNIIGSSSTGNVQGTTRVGGLLGFIDNGYGLTIRNSFAQGTVNGTNTAGQVGGLVGLIYGNASIYGSNYSGSGVTSLGPSVGGLVGENYWSTTIYNSYVDIAGNTGVQGTYNVGGMVGRSGESITLQSNGTNIPVYGASLSPYSTAKVTGTTASGTNAYVGGIVGYVGNYSTLSNVSVTASSITGVGGYVGGLIGGTTGSGYTTNLSSVTVNVPTISGSGTSSYVAGLLGFGVYVTATNATVNSTTITGTGNYVAGMVGYGATVDITNGVMTSDISSAGTAANKRFFGGLIGDAASRASISNSYAIGNINIAGTGAGTGFVGGLVGRMGTSGSTSNSYIQNAYYDGDISTDANAVNYGGLVGYFVPGTWFSNSYYDMGNSTINGAAVLTVGGLYTSQYDAWAKQGGASAVVTPSSRLPLSIASSGLTQDGSGAYLISSTADLDAWLPFTQSAASGAVNG